MNLAVAIAALVLSLGLALVAVTRAGVWLIERRHPPAGSFAEVAGTRLHYVHLPAEAPELPPVVFLHGASGNLLDQMGPVLPHLAGRAELLFVDRPGHGWSERGAGNGDPQAQAGTIAALMAHLGIAEAVIVGHSFGGAVAAAFALAHPERTRGLVFLAAATHPWPGGAVTWHYELAARPLLGRLFTETLALPGGLLRMAAATACVFSPNRMPDGYAREAAIGLVLRPAAFRANARDVAGLYDHVRGAAARYRQIAAPTVIVSGTRDTVVYEDIHSGGLARDIPGAELHWVRNLGHKPDWITPALVAGAVARAAGRPVDLAPLVAEAEARIAGDAYGPVERCADDRPRPAIGGAAGEGG
ncbi:alpha/beta hydrolase [Aquibium sp. A9E412]|uniref:alpha/beta fold hydrolase n=1 Tax=Aquibium sp. A9E412 TaxID=2976767 RepID=UPI0025AF6AF3|nr:alpha/beta hydrolase [Aquibium sp. A9E412]MDN2565676.1 alpha/beta hydrolase [Aquibium sp. A9E412]